MFRLEIWHVSAYVDRRVIFRWKPLDSVRRTGGDVCPKNFRHQKFSSSCHSTRIRPHENGWSPPGSARFRSRRLSAVHIAQNHLFALELKNFTSIQDMSRFQRELRQLARTCCQLTDGQCAVSWCDDDLLRFLPIFIFVLFLIFRYRDDPVFIVLEFIIVTVCI